MTLYEKNENKSLEIIGNGYKQAVMGLLQQME